MLEVLYEHRDELTRMATELPTLLRETGQQMHDAGTRAQTASGYLAGDVRELTGHAADMHERAESHLTSGFHEAFPSDPSLCCGACEMFQK